MAVLASPFIKSKKTKTSYPNTKQYNSEDCLRSVSSPLFYRASSLTFFTRQRQMFIHPIRINADLGMRTNRD